MWLFLDKEKNAPSNKWLVIRTATAAINFLKTRHVERISFSYDLGSDISGYHVANFIEQMAIEGKIRPMIWEIHSASPVGRANIQRAMESAEKYWNKQG